MKVKVIKYVSNRVEEEMDLTFPELIRLIAEDEGDYFFDFSPEEMYDEFCSYASDLVENEDELFDHKQEIIKELINERDRRNQENYESYVEDLVDFIETSVASDFDDDCSVPVFGIGVKRAAFINAIAELFNKYCGPELDEPLEDEKVE